MSQKIDQSCLSNLVRRFENRTLPKKEWNHHAHLKVAAWYLSQMSPAEVLTLLRKEIRAYNESTGVINNDQGGYHETLTRLFVAGITRERNDQPKQSIDDFISHLLKSPLADKNWPLGFYSRDRLMSVEARRTWVTPDLLPFPEIDIFCLECDPKE